MHYSLFGYYVLSEKFEETCHYAMKQIYPLAPEFVRLYTIKREYARKTLFVPMALLAGTVLRPCLVYF